jgi:peptide/nickel transport system substrate-binding protein
MHVIRARWLTGALSLLLAVALFSSGGQSVSAQTQANTLTVASGAYIEPFDPAIGVSGPQYRVFVNVYEGLLAYEHGTVKLIPALATSWSASPDLTTYNFKIRPGVKFHDGSTLDAEAVKLSFDRVRKIGMGPSVYLIKVKQVQVIDPMSVRITLTQPSSTFPMILPNVFIHGKAHANDPDDGRAWFADHMNGTGPFKESGRQRGEWILLNRNPNYWRGWPANRPGAVMLRFGQDIATQRLALERGDADMIADYAFGPDVDPATIAKNPNIKIVKSPVFRTFMYAMNSQKPGSPLKDRRVRKALALAFDYEAMKKVFFGNAEVPSGFLPPGYVAYDPSRPKFKRDLAAARRLLAEAGYSGGFEIDGLVANEEEQGRKLGLILQASLRDVGVKVNIVNITSFAIYAAQMSKLETAPKFGAHRMMSPLSADAGSYIRQVFGGANAGKPYNDSWYQNPEVDRLLDQAERTSDPQRRIALWRRAETIIINDQPVIFTSWVTPVFEPVQKRISSYRAHPLNYSGVYEFYYISMKP